MSLVGFPLLDDDNMVKIFQTILEWKFQADGYPEDVQSLTKKIVVGTLEMYKAAVAALLPTPLKVHYTFNLRDFAKVIFGILLMRQKECDGSQKHLRLWVHEVTRVIGDRLVDNSDRLWMLEHMRNVMKTNFNASFDDVMKHLDSDSRNDVIHCRDCTTSGSESTFEAVCVVRTAPPQRHAGLAMTCVLTQRFVS